MGPFNEQKWALYPRGLHYHHINCMNVKFNNLKIFFLYLYTFFSKDNKLSINEPIFIFMVFFLVGQLIILLRTFFPNFMRKLEFSRKLWPFYWFLPFFRGVHISDLNYDSVRIHFLVVLIYGGFLGISLFTIANLSHLKTILSHSRPFTSYS